jgi:hypothetical protein
MIVYDVVMDLQIWLASTNLVGLIPLQHYYREGNNVGCVLILLSMLCGIHEHLYGTNPLEYRIVSLCTAGYFFIGWYLFYGNVETIVLSLIGFICLIIEYFVGLKCIFHALWHIAAYMTLYSIGRKMYPVGYHMNKL